MTTSDDARTAVETLITELAQTTSDLEDAQADYNRAQIARIKAEADRDAAVKALADHMATAHITPKPVDTKAQQNIGIQCFADRGVYTDYAGNKTMLADLKVKKVRFGITPTFPQTQIDFYNDLYDTLGITFCVTVGTPRVPLTAAQWTQIEGVLSKLRGVYMLCNWNEPNHLRSGSGQPPVTGWQALTINHGAELRRRFDTKYVIGSAQLWSGTITTHNTDLKTLAAATGANGVKYKDTFERIVWHLYQPGQTAMKNYETLYRGLFGPLPITCSETGMSTAPNQTQGAMSMTETDAAAYLRQHAKMYLDAGHEVFLFELRDDPDDGTNRENWLGQYRSDKTPKPSATAIRELLLTP